MSVRPRVSVIVTAYNLARYLPAALDSALAQESPGGEVQIIVVDDGSTDDTQEVLAAYAGRIEVIRQENGGLVKAVDTGLGAVRGEYIALLDADDEWPRDRLRRHAEILDANPAVGLVHGDMEVIDADGATIHPSFFAWKRDDPTDGRILARLAGDNFVSGGASTFRSSLLPAIWPIAADAAYPDWWIATNIAAVAEIVHERGIANRYRFHGANMGLGADRPKLLAIERRELPFRRWMMHHLVGDESVSLGALGAFVVRWRGALAHGGMSNGGSVRNMLEVDREAAAAELRRAASLPDGRERCLALVRALAHDPFDGATMTDLEIAIMEATGQAPAGAELPPPLILLEARPELTLGFLEELVARPDLLRAYAQATAASGDGTLLILTPPGADLGPLVALVESDPVLSDPRCDLQACTEPASTPGRRLLAGRAGAVLSVGGVPGAYGGLPVHGSVGFSAAAEAPAALAA
ncbi:MAG TPA: glycosyltransferase [Solirubrobacteraceae bacterium]|nr:glycosyltransferase [Solirubrobacteraceae bacterium]